MEVGILASLTKKNKGLKRRGKKKGEKETHDDSVNDLTLKQSLKEARRNYIICFI